MESYLSVPKRTRAQESRAAIERMYVAMRHLINRGYYKPFGVSGETLVESLLALQPEIYGSIADIEKVELEGLHYVIQRLPKGIEECRLVKLSSEEGLAESHFNKIIPAKRRRNCYRIDPDQMIIEVTRGKSEIYDILTHLTFIYIEAEKIYKKAFTEKGKETREWSKLKEIATGSEEINEHNREIAFTYLAGLLGRTFEETEQAYDRFSSHDSNNDLFHVIYWLGKIAYSEHHEHLYREISFTAALRERLGHHIYGEKWAYSIKSLLADNGILDRPIHVISANMHSVLNSLFAEAALAKLSNEKQNLEELAKELSLEKNRALQDEIISYAKKHGMFEIKYETGTNVSVQIFDTSKIDLTKISNQITVDIDFVKKKKPVLIVIDYAFGEQAFETMDELLKPFEKIEDDKYPLNIESISVMGKAGILEGEKGDIIIPTAHIFEGTADNYPIKNDISNKDFESTGLNVVKGSMITVLGTSLQNKDILSYFKNSSWKAVGLEMEGAHIQKAVQAASKIRHSISAEVTIRYAYYASDNPLITGKTLASGSLGMVGVRPTYLITTVILQKIFTVS